MRGTIRARGKGRWQVQVYAGRGPDGREKRVARTIHGKKSDAETALRDLIREVEAGHHQGDDPTVTQLADQWTAARSRDWSPRTRLEYQRQIDLRITPHLGATRARRVHARDLDLLYASLAGEGVGDQTIRKTHTVLRSMFAQAVRWGIVAVNPAAHATPPRITEAPIEPPDPAAVTALLAAVDTDARMAAFVRLAATTGCRRSELCALQWDDIDLDQATLLVVRALDGVGGTKTTKTGRGKAMALDPKTLATLARWRTVTVEQHLAVRAGAPVWVFPADRDPTHPVRPDVMTHAWTRLARRHGLEGVRLHDLRHFMASRMLAAGVDVRTVANRLGHTNPGTTLRVYAHLIPEADRAAADDLGRLLDNG